MTDNFAPNPQNVIPVKFPDERWKYPIKQGQMSKYTITVGKIYWRQRFFVLCQSGKLWYFKNENKKEPCKKQFVAIRNSLFWISSLKEHCIEIERKEKPFLFFGGNDEEIQQWVEKLKEAGGIFSESKFVRGSGITEIARLSVEKWPLNYVTEWMSYIPLSAKETVSSRYGEKLVNLAHSGKDLLELEDLKLKENGIESEEDRELICLAIEQLKTNNMTFNLDHFIVLAKIMELLDGQNIVISQIWELAVNLSNPEVMCNTYLSKESLEQKILQKSFFPSSSYSEVKDRKVLTFESDCKEKHFTRSKLLSKKKLEGGEEEEDREAFEVVEEEEEVEGEVEEKLLNQEVSNLQKLDIRIILTERNDLVGDRTKFISPVLSKTPNLKPNENFGKFHTAVQIGPWFFEFNQSNLVVPKRGSSGSVYIVADFPIIKTISGSHGKPISLDDYRQKIASFCCHWNSHMFYSKTNPKKLSHLANCQEFLDQFLFSSETFGLESTQEKNELRSEGKFPGAVHSFNERVRTEGEFSLTFLPSKAFRKRLGVSVESFTFESHDQIDKFVKEIVEKKFQDNIFFFEGDFASEYRILKMFDRALWIRNFKFPDDPKFSPLPASLIDTLRAYPTGCVFGDPREFKMEL